ncbi:MAG: hypothetical protein JEY99_06860 [Spirochaetales bacterium]|nr:hypothetical protein [Spirochaetales bacterium]
MLEHSEQDLYFLQLAGIAEEETVRPDQEEIVQSIIPNKLQSKVERLGRWIDSVDQ